MVSSDEYYTIPVHEVLVARLVLEIGKMSQWDRNGHVAESRSRMIFKNLNGPTRPQEQKFWLYLSSTRAFASGRLVVQNRLQENAWFFGQERARRYS